MQTVTGTIKELEAKTGLCQTSLSVILKEASNSGQARIIDKIPSPTGTGRSSNVWEVKAVVNFNFGNNCVQPD